MTEAPRPATSCDPNEMPELLLAGARADGWLPARAAMHLLTFTDLPGSAQFAAHVEIRDAWSPGATVRGAWVRDWDALLADPDRTSPVPSAGSWRSPRRSPLAAPSAWPTRSPANWAGRMPGGSWKRSSSPRSRRSSCRLPARQNSTS